MRLYFLRKPWEIFKQLFEERKQRNFVKVVDMKQASIVDKEVEPENELPEVLRRKYQS